MTVLESGTALLSGTVPVIPAEAGIHLRQLNTDDGLRAFVEPP